MHLSAAIPASVPKEPPCMCNIINVAQHNVTVAQRHTTTFTNITFPEARVFLFFFFITKKRPALCHIKKRISSKEFYLI